jgi:hypothetical protein
MPRPEPEVILRTQHGDVIWEITRAERTYVITYMDEPIGIRSEAIVLGNLRRKYRKIAYSNEGSAIRQVRYLNERFDTEDFGYREV